MALTPRRIARMIDLSCVRADSTEAEMRDAVALAKKHVCAAVFVLPAAPALLFFIGSLLVDAGHCL